MLFSFCRCSPSSILWTNGTTKNWTCATVRALLLTPAAATRAYGGSGQNISGRIFNKETIMTKSRKANDRAQSSTQSSPNKVSKLDTLQALLIREQGASIAEMMAATGWQQHSVRGALAGALKKRLATITSVKTDGERRYRGDA